MGKNLVNAWREVVLNLFRDGRTPLHSIRFILSLFNARVLRPHGTVRVVRGKVTYEL